MNSNQCIPQHISKFAIGSVLLAAAIGLVVMGLTLMPIIGFIMAAPVAALAFYFFKIHINDQCEMDFSSK